MTTLQKFQGHAIEGKRLRDIKGGEYKPMIDPPPWDGDEDD